MPSEVGHSPGLFPPSRLIMSAHRTWRPSGASTTAESEARREGPHTYTQQGAGTLPRGRQSLEICGWFSCLGVVAAIPVAPQLQKCLSPGTVGELILLEPCVLPHPCIFIFPGMQTWG